jgi:hypothetical protein
MGGGLSGEEVEELTGPLVPGQTRQVTWHALSPWSKGGVEV